LDFKAKVINHREHREKLFTFILSHYALTTLLETLNFPRVST